MIRHLRWPPTGPAQMGRPDDKLRGPRRATAAKSAVADLDNDGPKSETRFSAGRSSFEACFRPHDDRHEACVKFPTAARGEEKRERAARGAWPHPTPWAPSPLPPTA